MHLALMHLLAMNFGAGTATPQEPHDADSLLSEAMQVQIRAWKDQGLSVDVAEWPEDGLVVLGIGQRSKEQKGRGGSGRSFGFTWSKMGTGFIRDGSGLMIHDGYETYVFNDGSPRVTLGAIYTDFDGPCWTGDGWYTPSGTTYFENRYHFQIPWGNWNWYTVNYYYQGTPIPMIDYEGRWRSTWFNEGVAISSHYWTCMYQLTNHQLCKGIDGNGNATGVTTSFTDADSAAYSRIQFADYAAQETQDVRWDWYRPADGGGYQFYQTTYADIPNPASYFSSTYAYSRIDIAGQYPATQPGPWYVAGFVKNHAGIYEWKFTDYFTINCTPINLHLDPPQPGVAGVVNTLHAGCSGPGRLVTFAYSMNYGATQMAGCPGVVFSLASPITFAGQLYADASGNATLSTLVPARARGLTLFLQAADLSVCEISNLVITTMQ